MSIPPLLRRILEYRQDASRLRGCLDEHLTLDHLRRKWHQLCDDGNGSPHCCMCMHPLDLFGGAKKRGSMECDRIDSSDDRNPYVYPDGRENFRLICHKCNTMRCNEDSLSKLQKILDVLRLERRELDEVLARTACVVTANDASREGEVKTLEQSYDQAVFDFHVDIKRSRIPNTRICSNCKESKAFSDFKWIRQIQEGQVTLPWYLDRVCLDCRITDDQRDPMMNVQQILKESRVRGVDAQNALDLFKQQNQKCAGCGEHMRIERCIDHNRSLLQRALADREHVSRLHFVKDDIHTTGVWMHAYCNRSHSRYDINRCVVDIRQLREYLRTKTLELENNWDAIKPTDWGVFLLRKRRKHCLERMRNLRSQMLEVMEYNQVRERTATWESHIGPCPHNTLFDPDKCSLDAKASKIETYEKKTANEKKRRHPQQEGGFVFDASRYVPTKIYRPTPA